LELQALLAVASRMLIGFKTKTSQAIDLSAWIAGNPVDVLATNFGKPPSLFEKFPRKDVFIAPNQ
jgi:oxalate decarboxylase